uniref:NADH dehydrogenase subunit 4L n=1 Tax=Gargara minuta TaxID=3021816 RepID=UPI00237C063B|nr:NADH dehydrogenase subunit 4L [Gargara minuta]WBV77337.1 NADH dehydrogenase subunit 4L [Gargara minuta]
MFEFFFFFFFFGLLSLSFVRKHIFLCLISLEFIIVYLLMIFYFYVFFFFCSFYLYVIFMVFCVCEGVLGLSLIVLLIRCHSNDYLTSIFLW